MHVSSDLRHAHCADIFTLFTLIFNVFVDFDTNSVDFYDSSLENVDFCPQVSFAKSVCNQRIYLNNEDL